MNLVPLIREDWRSARGAFVAFVLMIAFCTAFALGINMTERGLKEGMNRAAEPFSLLMTPKGSRLTHLARFVFLQPGESDLLTPEMTAEAFSRGETALYVSPIGLGDSYLGYPMLGVVREFTDHGGQVPLKEGRHFRRHDEAVVGSKVNLPVGTNFIPVHGQEGSEEHGEEDHHDDFTFAVVGRASERGGIYDYAIYVPIETVWHLHELPIGHDGDIESALLGHPFDPEFMSGVPAVVYGYEKKNLADAAKLRLLYGANREVDVFAPAEPLLEIYRFLGDGRVLLFILSIGSIVLVITASLLTVLASLGSTMEKLIILRSMGAPRRFLFLLVWYKTFLITFVGTALGFILASVGTRFISAYVQSRIYFSLRVSFGLTEVLIGAAILLAGALTAMVPAFLSYRCSPTRFLRG